jgi:YHS domain-containing protein
MRPLHSRHTSDFNHCPVADISQTNAHESLSRIAERRYVAPIRAEGMTAMAMTKDPVCGESVSTSTASRAHFEGIVYFLCGSACLRRFQANPREYATDSAERHDHRERWSKRRPLTRGKNKK